MAVLINIEIAELKSKFNRHPPSFYVTVFVDKEDKQIKHEYLHDATILVGMIMKTKPFYPESLQLKNGAPIDGNRVLNNQLLQFVYFTFYSFCFCVLRFRLLEYDKKFTALLTTF